MNAVKLRPGGAHDQITSGHATNGLMRGPSGQKIAPKEYYQKLMLTITTPDLALITSVNGRS